MSPTCGTDGIIAFIRDLANKAKKPKGEDGYELEVQRKKAAAYDGVAKLCNELGMPKELSYCDFIRDLHRRAGEGYSVEEIMEWFESRVWIGVNTTGAFREFISDSRVGIKAVTNRRGTK
jgi:hypothetical protein